ncbi:plasma membrane fusion protein prm1 [Boothiomyces macroporosus]|uniref:Plasma membrane fusion protein PRM1 n=1 Tax=Boothiomyces macroporosus TaxID=261099 RepID=A0AAD5UAH3_9FUNG|nr:plasma membrane fusion protein prm1 [Boothiomyces macroporosus]
MIIVSLKQHARQVKKEISHSCTSLEAATNILASTPRYVALSINRQTTKIIQKTEEHATQSVDFTVTLVKNILLYFLFRYQKALECLVTLSIQASLKQVSANSKEISDFVNNQLNAMSLVLDNSLDSLNSELSSIKNGLNSMTFGHGPSFNIPLPVTIPGVSDNMHWSLPASTATILAGVGNAPVSLDSIHNQVSKLVSGPFDSLKVDIDAKITELISKTNLSDPHAFDFLPLPQQITTIQFCDQLVDLSFIDRLCESLIVGIVYVVFACLIGIAGSFVFCAAVSMYEHQLEKKKLRFIEKNISGSFFKKPDPQEIYYYTKTNLFTSWLLDRQPFDGLNEKVKRRILWFMDYTSHPTAWVCIVVGLLGVNLIHLQSLLIPMILKTVYPTVKQELENCVHGVESIAQTAVSSTVGPYLSDMNSLLGEIETDINTNLFGFVDSTVSQIDTGITTIFSSFESVIRDALKPVPLIDQAIGDFYTCVLGNTTVLLKEIVQDLKSGVQVEIPRVTVDLFGFDSSYLIDNLDLVGKIRGVEGDLKQGAVLFEGHLQVMISWYKQTLWLQSVPFLILFLVGITLITGGTLAIVLDCIPK